MTPSAQAAEERRARALHQRLGALSAIAAVVEGDGVHWDCTAARGGRACRVHCFEDEYLVDFSEGTAIATGRTRYEDEVVGAVAGWLGGQELAHLYARFAFIDDNLRALRRIEAEALARFPALAHAAAREIRATLSDLHELWFHAGDRSCRVWFYGSNALPDAAFRWDDTELFVVRMVGMQRLATLLSRWLCERAMPSALGKEFLWLEVDEVALAFERGEGIEGEFRASWDSLVAFYEDLPAHWGSLRGDALALIARLRESGFDRTLRAGQARVTMVVSRSRRHGLRDGQDSIAFDFRPGRIVVSTSFAGHHEYPTSSGLDLPTELMALLEQLEDRPID